ncbi:MAG: hypothetical protein E5X53_20995 [Mesorhizobium sp.]|nr:MAG: hypothetical protein EOR73_22035 [Mesorhizobium sp.]TIP72185.1 MAG: hypothetical protein E5X55_19440 [Mesorhizobium sp.]TIQ08977.1 MAG: hypothetical protein E5X57_20670 [Mesorhizobium sp.]TIR50203.1 MAG: hypothetical protein E5X53_20995 [Mesorhizobium sp.]TJV96444.1 MAG: hypothetical protein E5X52_18645 [Mesorhizobium sp.]
MRHAIVRPAADGIWLADLATMALPDRQQLRVELLEMTRPRRTVHSLLTGSAVRARMSSLYAACAIRSELMR